jgi:hypothetical protein
LLLYNREGGKGKERKRKFLSICSEKTKSPGMVARALIWFFFD